MQRLDHIPFHLNEQFTSTDLNALQAVQERYLHDLAGFGAMGLRLTAATEAPSGSFTPTAALLGGLGATIDGSALSVQPGMLVHSVPAAPGDLSEPLSTRAIVVLPEATAIALPAPPTDSWYLVAVRPLLGDAPTAERRVWDLDTRKWSSDSLVKRRYARAEVYVLGPHATPTRLPDVPADGSVPLYAVKRPAGGGVILPGHVIDVRPQIARTALTDTDEASLLQCAWRTQAAAPESPGSSLSFTDTLAHLNAHVRVKGHELHVSARDLNLLALRGGSVTDQAAPAAYQWWYLYLARTREHSNSIPRRAQLDDTLRAGVSTAELNFKGQGLLVLSRVKPNGPESFGAGAAPRTNSDLIVPPLPFTTPIQIGDAVCIGQFKRAFAGGFVCAQCDGDHVTYASNMPVQQIFHSSYVWPESLRLFGDDGVGADTVNCYAPFGARTADLRVQYLTAPDAVYRRLVIMDGALDITHHSVTTGDPAFSTYARLMDLPLLPSGNLRVNQSVAGGGGSFYVGVSGYRF